MKLVKALISSNDSESVLAVLENTDKYLFDLDKNQKQDFDGGSAIDLSCGFRIKFPRDLLDRIIRKRNHVNN